MRDHGGKKHNTDHEKKHIDKLGTFCSGALSSRLILLKGYLAAMPFREKWGDINQYEIKVYVEEAIKKELADPNFNILRA